jgi:hypothetical protein
MQTHILYYSEQLPQNPLRGHSMIEKRDIVKCFSELTWIQNKDLRDKVVNVWKTAADRGKWQRLQ